jgi:MFS family permease
VTDSQVGVLDGIAFTIGLIAEIPSGAMADKFGRDKMMKIGQILVGVGFIIQAFGTSLIPFAVGQAVVMIGVAFVSGADEALFFDKLQFKESSPDWRKLITRGSQVALLAATAATVVGSWLHTFDPKLPWILTGLAFICSVLVVLTIKEEQKVKKKQDVWQEVTEHLTDIKEGFVKFASKKLLLYVPLIIAVQGLFYAAGWGLLRLVLLDRFHFSPFAGSIVISVSSLATVGLLSLMHKYAERLSEKRVLFFISSLAGVSLLASVFDIGMWGFFVIFALYAGEHMLQPFMSEIINYRTDSKQRATALSVASFLRTLPYIGLAPLIGFLNTTDRLEYFLVSWTIFIALAVFFYLVSRKQDVQISISEEAEIIDTEPRVPEIE